jgi:hypothetical protein
MHQPQNAGSADEQQPPLARRCHRANRMSTVSIVKHYATGCSRSKMDAATSSNISDTHLLSFADVSI